MKIAFLTEMGFEGKIPADHPNMRTEFAWMHTLTADHYMIYQKSSIAKIHNYDAVFIIFPKGIVTLNAVGVKLSNESNPISKLLEFDIVSTLKAQNNTKVFYIQEGPHWLWNDYEITDQIGFYSLLYNCDGIFAHNENDVKYYKGMFPHTNIHIMPSLMIEKSLENIVPTKENKAIIGGNFARWYGGFESYIVASKFDVPVWAQTSHAMRPRENEMDNLYHLPRLLWTEWMRALSTFKYAVHLMPTVAAGTFALNCAYFGIPCIGNGLVDTQIKCHPDLAVDVHDVEKASRLAVQLKTDEEFYAHCSTTAQTNYNTLYTEKIFKQKLNDIL